MFTLNSGEIFPIVRGIKDPYDTDTYYIRAVIKRADTDEVLETVDLVDKGDRYFVYNYTVPNDPSGVGYYISIVTSVYTDSGHTTKSENHADEFATYLVAFRPATAQMLGGGGGADISYKKIREVVLDAILEALKGLPTPDKAEKVDLSVIESKMSKLDLLIGSVISKIDGIKIPEIEKVDYGKIIGALGYYSENLSNKIDGIKIPEIDYEMITEKIDELNPVLSGLSSIINEIMKEIKSKKVAESDEFKGKLEVLGKIKGLLGDAPIEEKKAEIKKDIPWYRKVK
jgi:predicted transcriptional regulator YdeE